MRNLLFACLMLSLMAIQSAQGFDDSEIKHIEHPDWFIASPFFDLAEDLQRAQENGKKGLMILFTTEGCSYCDLFIRSSLSDPGIASLVQKKFDSIGMEIFADLEMTAPDGTLISVKQFAKQEDIEFSPALLFYGNNGQRLMRLIGYQSPDRFKTILESLSGNRPFTQLLTSSKMSAVGATGGSLRKDSLFEEAPYILDRRYFSASRPLLVIFEKSGCIECDNFHSNVLSYSDIRKKLQSFEVVRLNADDMNTPVLTPDGKKLTPAMWFETIWPQSRWSRKKTPTRVPSLVFFDEEGNEVLKTDALVLHQRMMNSLDFVLEQAYKKDWTYQRFARSKAIERSQKKGL